MCVHVIIHGGGVLGRTLAKELALAKHDATVIDRDAAVCEEISQELNATVIRGDATNVDVLKRAGIEKADVVAAVTGSDTANILACLVAKKMKNGIKTVSRVSRPEYEHIFKELGIDVMIFPSVAAAEYLTEVITKPDVVDLAFIEKGDAAIMEFQVKKGSRLLRSGLTKLKRPRDSLVVALYRDGSIILPEQKPRIQEGDRILVLSKNEAIDKVRKFFR